MVCSGRHGRWEGSRCLHKGFKSLWVRLSRDCGIWNGPDAVSLHCALARPLSCRWRDLPRSNGCRLHAATGIPPVVGGPATHAASYRYGDFFSGRVVFALLLPFSLEQQADRGTQIGQTLLFRLTLSVGTGDLEAGGPKSAFVRFAWMNYGCKLCHGVKIGRTRGPSSPTKAGPPEDGRIVRSARLTVDGERSVSTVDYGSRSEPVEVGTVAACSRHKYALLMPSC